MKSTIPPKAVRYTGDPRWLEQAKELTSRFYYQVAEDAMAHVIATALEAASRDGEMMAKALARIAELETESRVVQEANKQLAEEREEARRLLDETVVERNAREASRDNWRRLTFEAEAQCAVLKQELEADRARLKKYDRDKAHAQVSWAVRSGKIPRASTVKCKDCEDRAAEYDHYAGYAPAHWLHVEPVCIPCHKSRSMRRGELATGKNNGAYTKPERRSRPRGEAHGHSKITAADAKRMYELSVAGSSRLAIAAEFGVSVRLVGRVLRGDHWTARLEPIEGRHE